MIIRPVFNILLLPDITYFFKRDFFPGAAADQIEVGTDILFPFLKNDTAAKELNTLQHDQLVFLYISSGVFQIPGQHADSHGSCKGQKTFPPADLAFFHPSQKHCHQITEQGKERNQ